MSPFGNPTASCPLDAMTTIKLEENGFLIIIPITVKSVVKLGHFYILLSVTKIIAPLETNMTSFFKSQKSVLTL